MDATYLPDTRPINNIGVPNPNYLRPKQLLIPIPGDLESIWSHMKSLPQIEVERPSHLKFLTREFYTHTALPRVRNIELNPHFTGAEKFNPKWGSNTLALAVYLTGDEALDPCRRCRNLAGPFVGCILPKASTYTNVNSISCANCRYGWQGKKCTHYINNNATKPAKVPVMNNNIPNNVVDVAAPPPNVQPVADRDLSPERIAAIDDFFDSLPEPDAMSGVILPENNGAAVKKELNEENFSSVPSHAPVADLSDTQQATMNWETATGIRRTCQGQRVAFSAAYLSHNANRVPIDEDADVHLISVQPTEIIQLESKEHLYLVIVHGGTVRLTSSGDEEAIELGGGGIFKVFIGSTSLIENMSSANMVTLHIVILNI